MDGEIHMKYKNIHKRISTVSFSFLVIGLIFCHITQTQYEGLAFVIVSVLALIIQIASYNHGVEATKGKILSIYNLPLRTIFKVTNHISKDVVKIVDTKQDPHRKHSLADGEDDKYVSIVNAKDNLKIGQFFMLDEKPLYANDSSIRAERPFKTTCFCRSQEILIIHV